MPCTARFDSHVTIIAKKKKNQILEIFSFFLRKKQFLVDIVYFKYNFFVNGAHKRAIS